MSEYINRRMLIERIKKLPTYWADDGGTYGGQQKYPDGMFRPEDVIACIKSVSVVEIRHGHWIHVCNGSYGNKKTYCSVCGGIIEGQLTPPYCANCGARLDGKETYEYE